VDYITLLNKCDFYEENYNVNVIGYTHFKRKILAVEKINNSNFPTAILIASVHAREFITSDLLCKMIDEKLFDEIKDFNVSLVLMSNPDGVEISKYGLGSCPKKMRKYLYDINNRSLDFSLWKANGRGVDINNNFDADFGKFINSNGFSSSGYPGEFYESELETKAIINYTKEKNPFITISYHSKGEEIYYNYFQSNERLERDSIIAEKFSKSTGYLIKNVENVSCGGYKDYCVSKLKIPSLTIEVGSDNLLHPIDEKHLDEIFYRHKNIAKDLKFSYNVFNQYKKLLFNN